MSVIITVVGMFLFGCFIGYEAGRTDELIDTIAEDRKRWEQRRQP